MKIDRVARQVTPHLRGLVGGVTGIEPRRGGGVTGIEPRRGGGVDGAPGRSTGTPPSPHGLSGLTIKAPLQAQRMPRVDSGALDVAAFARKVEPRLMNDYPVSVLRAAAGVALKGMAQVTSASRR